MSEFYLHQTIKIGSKIRLISYNGAETDFCGLEGTVKRIEDITGDSCMLQITIAKNPPNGYKKLRIGSEGTVTVSERTWKIEVISDEWNYEENE